MGFWLIGIIAAVVLLAGMLFLMRRSRASTDSAASDAQLASAAAEAYPDAAAEGTTDADADADTAESQGALSVRTETIRSMREIAFGTPLPAVAFQIKPGDL